MQEASVMTIQKGIRQTIYSEKFPLGSQFHQCEDLFVKRYYKFNGRFQYLLARISDSRIKYCKRVIRSLRI